MKKTVRIALALLAAGLLALSRAGGETLELWTTSSAHCQAYQELAALWSMENPDQPVEVHAVLYRRERIASKLTRAFVSGIRFEEGELPDLADVDFLYFPDYVFGQTTELYPLQNQLLAHRTQADGDIGEALFTHNGICYALPYAYGELALCYRLDLKNTLPDFALQAASFEGIKELAVAYQAQTGQALLSVDDLGGECFAALCAQGESDSATGYETAVQWLRQMNEAGLSSSLPTGSAYGDAFADLMRAGEPPCFITTVTNLLTLAGERPEAIGGYGVLPLPSLQNKALRVCLPATGTAALIAGSKTILARKFLSFCRFSEQAKAYPLLYIGPEGAAGDEMLREAYAVEGAVCGGRGEETAPLPANLADWIQRYPQDVLSVP